MLTVRSEAVMLVADYETKLGMN
ncbi:hypothetical protein NVIE_2558 [Nitrososphaera viennensis EN76]|uniref:Uncharacterized protein n=1 Tax=Nitrososphaera viennensis EN76 TaxID=926571 RepID=A0A060HMQ0_9ARCH|nr:hypothetical protein NVIE_2558 [Nitrososphaera viennensis EN76]